MSLKFKRLGDIASFVNGYAFKPQQWGKKGLPIIRIQNLTGSSNEFNYYDGEIDEKYIVQKGDILIAWSASLGVHEWQKETAALNQHIFKVVFNKLEVNKIYFKFMVQRSLERALKFLHGSTMKHITKKYFDDILIPVPSIREQEKIASILVSAEGLIAKRRAQIEALHQLTQSVFFEMFGDVARNHKKFPKVKIKDFGKVVTGNTPSKKKPEYYGEYIEWIKSDNINTPSHYLTSASEYLSELGIRKGREVPPNSILVTCIAGSKSCIGNAAVANRRVSFNQQINAIIPNSDVNTYFLYTQFLVGKGLVQQASTNGMKGMVSKSSFEQIEFIKPPYCEQKKFGEIFTKIENQKKSLVKSLDILEKNLDSIMQRAFKEELFNHKKVPNA